MIEHIWCTFCEDRPSIGRMVVMRDKSRERISALSETDGAACDLHGRAWTGAPVAANEETGDYAVLQYVHPDYEQVTELNIIEFSQERTCCECGDPTQELPLWAADRILMANPRLVLDPESPWEGICIECAQNNACPHCVDDDDGDDGDDDEDEGEGFSSTHPYFH